MRFSSQVLTAAVLTAVCAVASGEPQLAASFSGLVDDQQGHSLDVDTAYAPSPRWEIGLGAGSTQARSANGDLNGTSLRASADMHGSQFGVRGYYSQWTSSALDTDSAGLRPYFTTGGLTLAVIAETRGLDIDYAIDTPNAQRATAHFSGTGYGTGIRYRRALWSGYAEGVFYHYGALSRYVDSQTAPSGGAPSAGTPAPASGLPSGLPTLPGVPAIPPPLQTAISTLPDLPQSIAYGVPTLSGSFVTLREGAFDHLLSAGLERSFERASLRFDWTGVQDAVLDTDINSFSTGYRYSFTPRLNGSVSLGVSTSRYGSVTFGGLSFGVSL